MEQKDNYICAFPAMSSHHVCLQGDLSLQEVLTEYLMCELLFTSKSPKVMLTGRVCIKHCTSAVI